jgi:hypothetical protein
MSRHETFLCTEEQLERIKHILGEDDDSAALERFVIICVEERADPNIIVQKLKKPNNY